MRSIVWNTARTPPPDDCGKNTTRFRASGSAFRPSRDQTYARRIPRRPFPRRRREAKTLRPRGAAANSGFPEARSNVFRKAIGRKRRAVAEKAAVRVLVCFLHRMGAVDAEFPRKRRAFGMRRAGKKTRQQ